jgi:hypothetical protein
MTTAPGRGFLRLPCFRTSGSLCYAWYMADPQLVQALDYILNRSDEASISVLAEAVVRRRRELTLFGNPLNIPDPQRMAEELSKNANAGIGAGIKTLKESVRNMAIRIIREQAPELTDGQVAELTRAWIPENPDGEKPAADLTRLMIEQFTAFSRGTLNKAIEKNLRDELGAWPERYWKAFPPVIRLIITDFLQDRITEDVFNAKIAIALDMQGVA